MHISQGRPNPSGEHVGRLDHARASNRGRLLHDGDHRPPVPEEPVSFTQKTNLAGLRFEPELETGYQPGVHM